MGDAADRWRALAEATLGASLDTLVGGARDGLAIHPLYERRPEAAQPWRTAAAWRVAQRVDHPDPTEAGRLALLDLDGGADALTIVTAGSPFSRGFGLAPTREALGTALDKVELDLVATRLDAGRDTHIATGALAAMVKERRLTSATLDLDLGFDPIGIGACLGSEPDRDDLRFILDLHDGAGLAGRPLLADGRPYHEAGAGAAQELGATLAGAVAYLRWLAQLGLRLDAARRLVAILVVTDADVLVVLAKVRAIRRLWARVETACGLTPEPLRLHAETAWRMMARIDPWVNVMRATAATFAAGLGGADAITALPFTLSLGLPDDGARRLARNAQRVLIDEAHLDGVDDPAAGSGGIEALTDGLCEAAWSAFQEIEAEGGIEASLRAGALQARIATSARDRAAAIESLETGLVGISRFPSLDAPTVGVLDVEPRPADQRTDGALPSVRDAAPFEALRDAADAFAAGHGRPTIFLAALGPPAAFGPRAAEAANLFAAAGIATTTPIEAADIDAIVAGFRQSGTPVACLCGSDRAYATDAGALAEALRNAGAARLLLVGRQVPDAVSGPATIDRVIRAGIDVIDVLRTTLDALTAR